MRWISPRAVLFQPHKAFDPVNPAISRGMRQSASGVRFAGRTLNFPTAKGRISQAVKFKMPTRVPYGNKSAPHPPRSRAADASHAPPTPRAALHNVAT